MANYTGGVCHVCGWPLEANWVSGPWGVYCSDLCHRAVTFGDEPDLTQAQLEMAWDAGWGDPAMDIYDNWQDLGGEG